jgi:GPN-loop GTPase
MSRLTSYLSGIGFSLATVYMLDVNFITDDSKYLSGILMALSTSMNL